MQSRDGIRTRRRALSQHLDTYEDHRAGHELKIARAKPLDFDSCWGLFVVVLQDPPNTQTPLGFANSGSKNGAPRSPSRYPVLRGPPAQPGSAQGGDPFVSLGELWAWQSLSTCPLSARDGAPVVDPGVGQGGPFWWVHSLA